MKKTELFLLGLMDNGLGKVHGRLVLYMVTTARLISTVMEKYWNSHNGGKDYDSIRISRNGKITLFSQG